MKKAAQGFSLIEIMVVLVIIGLLATMVAPQVINALKKGNDTVLISDFKTMETALERYKLDNYVYPSTEQGLEALVSEPSSDPKPRNYPDGGYVKKLPKDPWKNPYQYVSPGDGHPYDIYSLGADGVRGGTGDNADVSVWDDPDQKK